MKTKVTPGSKFSFALVKWDGDPPENWKAINSPEQHPKCAEVIKWDLGQPAQIVYKRE